MKNKKLFIQYKIYLIGGGLLVLIIAVIVFIVEPAFNKLNNDVDTVQKMLLDTQIKKNKISKLPELEQKFVIIKKNKDKLNVLFAKDNIVDLVQKLEDIADETNNNIAIKVIDSSDKAKIKKVKKISEDNLLTNFNKDDYFEIEVDLTGNYEKLFRFVYKLNNMHYYNTITSFDISVDQVTIKGDEKVVVPKDNSINFLSGNIFNKKSVEFSDYKQKILRSKLRVIFYLNK